MEQYQPPFTLTSKIQTLLSDISVLVGKAEIIHGHMVNPELRRQNRIKSIQSTCAIEQNTLTVAEVTDILDGKKVLGPPDEIIEVKNAYELYSHISDFNPLKLDDLLAAHKILMFNLVQHPGEFRKSEVGVYDGSGRAVHIGPPFRNVPSLMHDLFLWLNASDTHILIKSCVFHFEFEFIHPFVDGNGRLGRFWHTLLLSKWNELFAYVPVETAIKNRQQEYYAALRLSQQSGNSTAFIEFSLQTIYDALREVLEQSSAIKIHKTPIDKLLEVLGAESLSAADLMGRLGLRHRQSFMNLYLQPALKKKLVLMMFPDKPNSRNQKYRKKG